MLFSYVVHAALVGVGLVVAVLLEGVVADGLGLLVSLLGGELLDRVPGAGAAVLQRERRRVRADPGTLVEMTVRLSILRAGWLTSWGAGLAMPRRFADDTQGLQ